MTSMQPVGMGNGDFTREPWTGLKTSMCPEEKVVVKSGRSELRQRRYETGAGMKTLRDKRDYA